MRPCRNSGLEYGEIRTYMTWIFRKIYHWTLIKNFEFPLVEELQINCIRQLNHHNAMRLVIIFCLLSHNVGDFKFPDFYTNVVQIVKQIGHTWFKILQIFFFCIDNWVNNLTELTRDKFLWSHNFHFYLCTLQLHIR